MSHTIQRVTAIPTMIEVGFTIVNYASGGEAITPVELGLPSVDAAFFAPTNNNSLGVVIIPALIGGKVFLAQVAGGVLSQLPATAGLNCVIRALVVSEALGEIFT